MPHRPSSPGAFSASWKPAVSSRAPMARMIWAIARGRCSQIWAQAAWGACSAKSVSPDTSENVAKFWWMMPAERSEGSVRRCGRGRAGLGEGLSTYRRPPAWRRARASAPPRGTGTAGPRSWRTQEGQTPWRLCGITRAMSIMYGAVAPWIVHGDSTFSAVPNCQAVERSPSVRTASEHSTYRSRRRCRSCRQPTWTGCGPEARP
jgi:hypothetical protein